MAYVSVNMWVKTECVSIAMFQTTYFYVHFGISHKRMLEGNIKMHINSKKTYAHNWVGYIFYPIRKNAYKLRLKHFYRINSTMCMEVMWLCAMRWDNLIRQRTDLIHNIYILFWSFIYWSVVKVFLYNYCLTRLRSQTVASTFRKQGPHLLLLLHK